MRRQPRRLDAEVISKPQAPHQQDGAQNAVVLPAPAGSDDRRADAKRPAQAFEPPRHRDVLHQRQVRKTANRHERFACHKDRLIAAGDAGQPRAPIDHAGTTAKNGCRPAMRRSKRPQARYEGRSNQTVGVWRQRRIGVQEKECVAAAERGARIQRRAASGRSRDHPVGERPRQIGRAVG